MARSRSVVLTIGIVLVSLVASVTKGRGADVLIVEKPGRLVLLDRYQQSMPAQERSRLPAFVPMVVREQDARLGDGITACLVVEVGDGLFYIVKEEMGDLAGKEKAGFIRRVQNVRLLADTVEALTPIPAHSPDRKITRTLQRGERIVLLFESGKEMYARRLSGGYVWVAPRSTVTAWRTLRSGPVATQAGDEREVSLVRSALDGANGAFVSLFDHYNRSTGRHRATPRWNLEVRETGFSCVIENCPDPQSFATSTDLLARELQTLLLGRGMKVAVESGSIDIRHVERAQETR